MVGEIVVASIRDLHPELYRQYRLGEYRNRSIEIIRQQPAPSMEASGIDVFQTVRNNGYTIDVGTKPNGLTEFV